MTTWTFYKLPQHVTAQRELTASAKLLLAVVLDCIGRNGVAWIGERKLARKTGLNRETVSNGVAALEAAELLAVERRGTGQSHRYRTGRKFQPLPTESGQADRPENPTRGGRKIQPEAAGKSDRIQTDLLNQTGQAAAPPDPRVREFIAFFCREYETAIGKAYIVTFGKDGKLIKGLLQKLGGNGVDAVAELQQATKNMLGDAWGRDHAGIGLLSSQINRWRDKPSRPEPPEDPLAVEGSRRLAEMMEGER